MKFDHSTQLSGKHGLIRGLHGQAYSSEWAMRNLPIPGVFAPVWRKRWERFSSDKRGLAAVEFAMIAIPFFLLIFGLLEVCVIFIMSMAIGTAGYTAALCVNALIDHGTAADDGAILVTGATGGVGSISVALLAAAGYQVTAATGKLGAEDYLTSLGAHAVIDRSTLAESGKPLQKELWNGVIDAVGGNTLANACAQTRYSGAVAACGLAESPKLPTTVMPFILRGVTLYGIDSVMAPIARRERAWQRIADHLNTDLLDGMVQEISLAQALTEASSVIAGTVTGRLLVDVNR